MKIKQNSIIICVISFLLICFSYFYIKTFFFKRNYFKNNNQYWGSYFFIMEEKPVWYIPFKNVYKVKTNIYTNQPNIMNEKNSWEQFVFMKDSILFEIIWDNSLTFKEYPLSDLTKKGKEDLEFIGAPNISKIDSMNNYRMNFFFPSRVESEFIGLEMKVNYTEGIELIKPISK